MNLVEKVQEANGFTALNCEDGFRKDNRLWFGECSECGERITNSHFDGVWKHTIYSEKGYYSKEEFDRNGMYNFGSSRQVDYCPKVVGEEINTIRWYQIDGEKFYA
jgi:hypothetical protein